MRRGRTRDETCAPLAEVRNGPARRRSCRRRAVPSAERPAGSGVLCGRSRSSSAAGAHRGGPRPLLFQRVSNFLAEAPLLDKAPRVRRCVQRHGTALRAAPRDRASLLEREPRRIAPHLDVDDGAYKLVEVGLSRPRRATRRDESTTAEKGRGYVSSPAIGACNLFPAVRVRPMRATARSSAEPGKGVSLSSLASRRLLRCDAASSARPGERNCGAALMLGILFQEPSVRGRK